MSSNNVTPTPVWTKFHSSRPVSKPITTRPSLPPRPVTSPALPTPPETAKATHDKRVPKELGPIPRSPGSDHRWSEVVPPSTALTFAAVWDPEDGLVTFGGASLSTSENGGGSVSPEDADAHSQVLTVDFLTFGSSPNTAQDSLPYPYSQSRFAASEVSTQRFPVSPTRRSSAGTGLALDMSVRPTFERETRGDIQHDKAHHLDASPTKSGRSARTRANHHHSSSQDSTASNSLAAFGAGLYNRFRRVATPRQGHSRAERYSFLRRTAAGKASGSSSEYYEHDGRAQPRVGEPNIDMLPPSPPPKSAGLRSIFARSIWLRGGVETGRNERLVCRQQIDDEHDGITLDTGFDHIDVDEDLDGTWLDQLGGGCEELDSALNRDVNRLKSTFSWTTTSTSRYIDVAAYFDADSDTDSTVSSLGVPVASTVSPFHSQQANSVSVHAQEGDCNSPWLPVDPPTPRAGLYVSPYQRPQRKLFRKDSKTQIAIPPLARAAHQPRVAKASEDQHRRQVCPQCDIQIGCVDLEAIEHVMNSKKGKGRANSQPDLPDAMRDTVGFGRPAALRSSSSPASLPFPHTRSQSLPGSRAATPAEVLSRASYNHEWAYPVTSRPISHARSPSAPQPGPSTTTMSMRPSTTPTRTCQHVADMRDVLRGVRSGIRPSTPIPGMPPVPPKNRPPPTSFRPVSAGGRERGRSRTPMSSAAFSQGRLSELAQPLTRSQSHRASAETPSSMRSRTRSLESLRGTAQAFASASTAPLRSLWRARSFIRISHSDQPGRSDVDGNNDEDGVWVCVDIKAPSDKAKTSLSSEGQATVSGATGLGNTTDASA